MRRVNATMTTYTVAYTLAYCQECNIKPRSIADTDLEAIQTLAAL